MEGAIYVTRLNIYHLLTNSDFVIFNTYLPLKSPGACLAFIFM